MNLDESYQKGRKFGLIDGIKEGQLLLIKNIRNNCFPDKSVAIYLNKIEKNLKNNNS